MTAGSLVYVYVLVKWYIHTYIHANVNASLQPNMYSTYITYKLVMYATLHPS